MELLNWLNLGAEFVVLNMLVALDWILNYDYKGRFQIEKKKKLCNIVTTPVRLPTYPIWCNKGLFFYFFFS